MEIALYLGNGTKQAHSYYGTGVVEFNVPLDTVAYR